MTGAEALARIKRPMLTNPARIRDGARPLAACVAAPRQRAPLRIPFTSTVANTYANTFTNTVANTSGRLSLDRSKGTYTCTCIYIYIYIKT